MWQLQVLLLLLWARSIPSLSFTPEIKEINIAAAFDVLRDVGNGATCISPEGLQIKAAILMAVEELNNKTDGVLDDVLPDVHLNLSSFHYSETSSTDMAIKMFHDFTEEIRRRSDNNSIVSCVGPTYNNVVSTHLLEDFSIVNMGYADSSLLLSHPVLMRNYVRNYPSEAVQGVALADLVKKHFMWERVSVVFSQDQKSVGVFGSFDLRATQLQIKVLSNHMLDVNGAEDIINQLKARQPRIVLLLLKAKEMPGFIFKGVGQGLFKEGIQILTWDVSSGAPYFHVALNQSSPGTPVNSFIHHAEAELENGSYEFMNSSMNRTNFIAESFKGLIGLKMQPVVNLLTTSAFYRRYTALNPNILLKSHIDGNICSKKDLSYLLPQGRLNFSDISPDMINSEALFAYDAIISLARALHHLLYYSDYKSVVHRSSQITSEMLKDALHENVSFDGITGRVSFNPDISRSSDICLEVFNFHPEEYVLGMNKSDRLLLGDYDLGFVKVGHQHSETFFRLCNKSEITCKSFIFNSENNDVISDRPPLVTVHMTVAIVSVIRALASLGFLMVLICAFFVWYYEHSRLVRVAQPFLSLVVLLGCVLSFAASFHMTVRDVEGFGDDYCHTLDWLQDIAIVCIIAPLLMKKLRINLILSASTHLVAENNRFSISNKKGNIVVVMMVVMSVILQSIVQIDSICGSRPLAYKSIRSDQFENSQEAMCPLFDSVHILCNSVILYSGLLLLGCVVLCFYHNRSDFVVEEGDACLRAIFTLVVALVLFTAVHASFNILGIDSPSIRDSIKSLFFVAVPYRLMKLLYFSMWKKLVIDNKDLDRKFVLVTRDSIHNNLFHMWYLKLRYGDMGIKLSIAGLSTRSVGSDSGQFSFVPPPQSNLLGKEEAVAPANEKDVIQAEIDALCERLDVLANREICQTNMSQLKLKSINTLGAHFSLGSIAKESGADRVHSNAHLRVNDSDPRSTESLIGRAGDKVFKYPSPGVWDAKSDDST